MTDSMNDISHKKGPQELSFPHPASITESIHLFFTKDAN